MVSITTGPELVPLLTSEPRTWQAVERRLQRVLADRVVDDRNALAVGQLADPLGDVLAAW
jgi:hypothetical protein